MNGLSLFSGGGIGELAFKYIIPNYRTIGYVEWDKYCQEVIRARIRDGVLDDAPIFDDIREFNRRYASLYAGKVDWLSGGFPCQPFSVAGRQLGEADERNMWPATIEAISIIRPRYCFLENVPNLLTHEYIRRIFGDLAANGYDCEWDVISARFVGTIHKRERLWILGSNTQRKCSNFNVEKCRVFNEWKINKRKWGKDWIEFELGIGDVAPSKWRSKRFKINSQPNLIRSDNGMAYQMDRLKAIGNGWVPQVVKRILQVEQYAANSD